MVILRPAIFFLEFWEFLKQGIGMGGPLHEVPDFVYPVGVVCMCGVCI